MRKLDHISSHGHPKKDLGNVLCHRSEEGSAGATFLIRLAPHSYRVESGIYEGAAPPPPAPDPSSQLLRLCRVIVMRFSYQLFKVVMRSIKTSLRGGRWEGGWS